MSEASKMPKMLLIFSRELTPGQIEDAKKILSVNEFVPLSSDMHKLWQNIPVSEDFVKIYDAISQSRNGINHAGIRDNHRKPDDLINNLKKYYDKFKAGADDV